MTINGIETFGQNKTANGFNKFFTEIGPKLASSIPTSSKDFKRTEFKSPGFDNIYHLLLIFASAVIFVHSRIFLISHCKQEFFQTEDENCTSFTNF